MARPSIPANTTGQAPNTPAPGGINTVDTVEEELEALAQALAVSSRPRRAREGQVVARWSARPCTHCGAEPRASTSSWGRACIAEKMRQLRAARRLSQPPMSIDTTATRASRRRDALQQVEERLKVMRSIQGPPVAAVKEAGHPERETPMTPIPTVAIRGRKPRRNARGPKPPALTDSATAIINEISDVIDADDPTKKPSAEQTATPTSNAEIGALSSPASNGDTARFHQHLRNCAECDGSVTRNGRLCLTAMLLARPRDLRIRARAPRMWTV